MVRYDVDTICPTSILSIGMCQRSKKKKATYIQYMTLRRPLTVCLKLVLQTIHGQGKASRSLQSARIITVHEFSGARALPSASAARRQARLSKVSWHSLGWATLVDSAPTSSLTSLTPVRPPKHCHPHPGRLLIMNPSVIRHPHRRRRNRVRRGPARP